MPNSKDDVYGDHISARFNDELTELKTQFLNMGGMVESQVERSIEALTNNDSQLAEDVRQNDKAVDRMEMDLDEEAILVIARRQPAARDLRLVISVIKMVADLERVGDEAKKIAQMAIKLSEEGQAPRGYVEIRHIGKHVLSMLHDALDAFARLDSDQALRVMKEDKQVDEEYQAAARALLTFMMEDARNITRCMMVMWVLRALERIGDHACNIAEHVIFMAKGEDVRHSPMEEAERVVGR
ncbi:phosphate-specific transport system accessory protein PhoU [Marinobacter sp. JH2]|uniref:phosphate signaling complex protein PhoU n=1 Tax=Marinobacter sp. AL4B TaxID=2871173 RepID=UPI001056A109|nr:MULTISPECIES: phosphate signaling complex protein PhoU [unclassified Marinobacter]MBZ0335103.1 phosphate signaling complex protein PhoU [Marinobacter sp. AL4B]QBM18890.1 phosphate-specific transport system accessory protein PhoU [Marinobacter sp. JH2]